MARLSVFLPMYFYLHIPFCRRKCAYCSFASFAHKEDEVDRYCDGLIHEMNEYFDFGEDKNIESIYFGGGTPSILGADRITRLIGEIRSRGIIFPNSEITVECNPEDIKPEFVTNLREAGVSRISVGVQSLHNPTLEYCGRAMSETIESALQCLDTIEFPNVSIDWIIGLPYEVSTLSHIQKTLNQHKIHHMSVYMLEKNSLRNFLTEGHEWVVQEYKSIREHLEKEGFYAYEISNFARQGYECKHNRAYWTHKSYRGFWLSAASFSSPVRFENASTFSGYYAGEKTTEILTDEQLRLERIMFSMRTREGCPIELIENRSELEKMKQAWLIRQEGGVVFPTLSWIFILDYIIASVA